MSLAAALVAEFDQEMKNTRRVLERLPEDRLGWRPHAKSWTTAELATHVVNIPRWGVITFQGDSFDVAPGGAPLPPPPAITGAAEALTRLDAVSAEVRDVLVALKDAAMLAVWTLKMNGETRFALPRAAVWRSMVMNHLIHHRGELCVYLRLLDQPLPAIYGPSADERS